MWLANFIHHHRHPNPSLHCKPCLFLPSTDLRWFLMTSSECNFQWECFTVEERSPLRLALDVSRDLLDFYLKPIGKGNFAVKLWCVLFRVKDKCGPGVDTEASFPLVPWAGLMSSFVCLLSSVWLFQLLLPWKVKNICLALGELNEQQRVCGSLLGEIWLCFIAPRY